MKLFLFNSYPPEKDGLKQLYRIMKLSFILILVTFLNISASVYSQKTKLNLSLNDVSLEKVFNKISENSEFEFFYSSSVIDLSKTITIKSENSSVEDVLNKVFRGTDLDYTVNGKQILVTTKKILNQSKFNVKGKVTASDGISLPGVSVMEKGTDNGVVTDSDGNYNINVADKNATLVFSFVGMKSSEIAIAARSEINVALSNDFTGLDEVVVVGYGTQKKVNLTGAVDVISSKAIESRQSPSVSQLLQGSSPGLSFSVGNYGFQPGANMNIQIRGMGTLNGGGAPYVVIDGVPGDMNRLNPDDVESISVLKDAAASAIYGARAPYGVIVITTKSGKKNENFKTTYSGNFSVASPQNLPEMLNSYKHARAINEAGIAGRGGQFFRNDIIDNIIAYQEGDYEFLKSRPNFPADATHFETVPRQGGNSWGFNQFGNANRDWFDEYYGKGYIQKHDLSISGGTSKTSYYVSAGSYKQSGTLNYGTDTFERYNILAKVKTELTKFWDFTYQPRFSKTVREIPNMDKQGSYDLIFHQIARTMPSNAKYDGYGNHMIQSKIPWVNDAGTDITETIENWQSFATEIRPLKGWKINADFAFRNTDYYYQSKELTVYDNMVDKSQVPSGNTVPSNVRSTHKSNQYWTTNIYTSYTTSFLSKHTIKLMAGTQFERTNNKMLTAYRTNLLVQDVPSINTADGEIQASEQLRVFGTQGYFGRLNYNYAEKYLLEANIRYDGTSRFKDGDRWGLFPSFSAGWNIDKENFWDFARDYVNTFKLRGSWGELGNQNVALYQGLELIPLSGNAVNWIFDANGARPIGYAGTPYLVSPDLTWETARTMNFGTNMSFLDGKLKFDFDWFERTTYDMIGPVPAEPGVLGASVPRRNNATLRSRGWELNLSWRQSFKNGFAYNVAVNLYDSKAEVTKYHNPTGILSAWYEGREQGEIWGYTSHGLYQTQEEIDEHTSKVDLSDITGLTWNTGDVKYEDINGDGKVDNGSYTLEDHGDLKVIGNSTPRYQFGINMGASYKGFDISMVWRGVAKRDLWFGAGDNIFWGFKTGNQSSLFPQHMDYFRDTEGTKYVGLEEGEANYNKGAYFPRPYLHTASNNKNRLATTRYLQNGAYLRLQNLQIGYNLPKNMLKKLRLSKLRLNISGENLLTFSDLPDGIDPVAIRGGYGAGKTYGPDRIYSFGVQITY